MAIGRKTDTGCCGECFLESTVTVSEVSFFCFPNFLVSIQSLKSPQCLTWTLWLFHDAFVTDDDFRRECCHSTWSAVLGGRGNPLLASNWFFSVPCSFKERWPMSEILGLGYSVLHTNIHTLLPSVSEVTRDYLSYCSERGYTKGVEGKG